MVRKIGMILWLGIGCGVWGGCAEKPPDQVGMTEQQFVDVCVDVLALQADSTLTSKTWLEAREKVFQKHGISPQDVATFIAYRKAHPEAWTSTLNLLKEKLGDDAEVSLQRFRKGMPDSSK